MCIVFFPTSNCCQSKESWFLIRTGSKEEVCFQDFFFYHGANCFYLQTYISSLFQWCLWLLCPLSSIIQSAHTLLPKLTLRNACRNAQFQIRLLSEHGTKPHGVRIPFLTRQASHFSSQRHLNPPTFAAAPMCDAQARFAAFCSLVVAHGLIGSAIRGTQGLGLGPGAMQVTLRVSVTVAY